MLWLREQLDRGAPCDAECGRKASARAHLKAKGSGGEDRGNTVLLCLMCHRKQEKRTTAFCRETGVDLQAKADQWAARYTNREADAPRAA